MICDKCHEREAHIKVTKVVNGVSETMNLCEQCAARLPGFNPVQADLSKAILNFLTESFSGALMQARSQEAHTQGKRIACPTCGKTYEAFIKDGLFGCADCYEAFDRMIQTTVKGMQGAEQHTGKRPRPASSADPAFGDAEYGETAGGASAEDREGLTPEEQVRQLKKRLDEALLFEDYEKAAAIRDEMKALEAGDEEAQHG